MLFGEYLVLNGAKSLAFPLKYGQTLDISTGEELEWESSSPDGTWFTARYDHDLAIVDTNDVKTAEVLQGLLKHIRGEKPSLPIKGKFHAHANFNLKWGLGSSSTLISLLSQWSGVDPYQMLNTYFGGSGYDLACATAKGAIIYEVDGPTIQEVELNQNITDQLLFVYLGQKQSSKDEIERFEKQEITSAHVQEMNDIIAKALSAKSIEEFETELNRSEKLLSPLIGQQMLKERIFADYDYSVKSMGAWGGDFFLATFRDLDQAKTYFKNKGMDTMFTYYELVK